MKKLQILFFAFVLLFGASCTQQQIKEKTAIPEKVDVSSLPNIMTPEVLWKLKRLSDVQISPDKKTLLFGISRYSVKENKGDRDLYTMPVKGGEITKVTDFIGSEFNGIWRPDGKKIGFLSAKGGSVQLWEMNPDGTHKIQITDSLTDVTGFKYSPDGSKILFTMDVKLDQTPVDLYPDLPKANVKIVDELMYRHWDQWCDAKWSHIFVADYQDGKISNLKDLMPDERFDAPMKPWDGLEQIKWSPDGNQIAYSCKKLTGKDYTTSTNSEIYIYNLKDNTTTNLTAEGFEGYDKEPIWSPDGKMIAWTSMATPGFESDKNRIIIHNFEDGSNKDFTEGFDQSAGSLQWNEKGNAIYFISGIEATYQIYSLEIETGKIHQITHGDHNYTAFALAQGSIIGAKMTMQYPIDLFAIDFKGHETQITFVNKEVLDHIVPAEYEKRWVGTTDGKKELVWVIYPPNFDKSKKYPTLLYCQGGPQSAVSQFFSYRWNFQIMASNGYIVVAPNRRGLPSFGQEWNDQISGDYGGQNMLDYLSAIDTLAKEPYVDNDNLGAIGASYGGYSVYWLAGHHEGRFKALIAHCGIYNIESMYAQTEETFFVNHDNGGAPWDSPTPKTYTDFNPAKFIGNWDAPILIITGGNDFRIPYTQSIEAFNSAQLKGVPSRFLFFPDESHFVVQPQNAVLWQREFKRFLDENLKK
ncbi:MAG: peptidase S9 [Bacteroidetes bacterium]|nr:MAG: peptidase S9 [Bacteroidota bacterium]